MTPLLLIASPNKRKASTLPVLAFGARSAVGRPAKKTDGLVAAETNGIRSTREVSAPPASINGLRRNASPVSSGRHTRIGTRSEKSGANDRDSFELHPRCDNTPHYHSGSKRNYGGSNA